MKAIRPSRRTEAIFAALVIVLTIVIATAVVAVAPRANQRQAVAVTPGARLAPPMTLPAPVEGMTGWAATCNGQHTGCRQYERSLINGIRQKAGLPPLAMDWNTSKGVGCAGAQAHAKEMSIEGLYHVFPKYPNSAPSFPYDFWPCVGQVAIGQNAGYGNTGSRTGDMDQATALMLSEPHTPQYCATASNHACSILSTLYHKVGIGVYWDGSKAWLVEDFSS